MRIPPPIRLLAGCLVLLGVALTYLVSPWWLLLPTFVVASLAQSVHTGFCPASQFLGKLGLLGKDGDLHCGVAKKGHGKTP
jgi:hypothetical protein